MSESSGWSYLYDGRNHCQTSHSCCSFQNVYVQLWINSWICQNIVWGYSSMCMSQNITLCSIQQIQSLILSFKVTVTEWLKLTTTSALWSVLGFNSHIVICYFLVLNFWEYMLFSKNKCICKGLTRLKFNHTIKNDYYTYINTKESTWMFEQQSVKLKYQSVWVQRLKLLDASDPFHLSLLKMFSSVIGWPKLPSDKSFLL